MNHHVIFYRGILVSMDAVRMLSAIDSLKHLAEEVVGKAGWANFLAAAKEDDGISRLSQPLADAVHQADREIYRMDNARAGHILEQLAAAHCLECFATDSDRDFIVGRRVGAQTDLITLRGNDYPLSPTDEQALAGVWSEMMSAFLLATWLSDWGSKHGDDDPPFRIDYIIVPGAPCLLGVPSYG